MFFDGFTLEERNGSRLRAGGAGSPLLLLHGQRQTHAMWHAVAPRLADRFSLICPDLPAGMGEAASARWLLDLMRERGHERFAVAGHDRGGHVACRLALEAAERVERLAVLEIVPVPEHMNREDMSFALAGYPVCWFAQLHPKPEALITHAPAEWFQTSDAADSAGMFHPEAVADYLRAAQRQAEPVEVSTDRRALGAADEDGRERRRITCPLLVLWGSKGRIGGWYDPVQLWRDCADAGVSGAMIPGGHFLAEEAPEAVAEQLGLFFAAGGGMQAARAAGG